MLKLRSWIAICLALAVGACETPPDWLAQPPADPPRAATPAPRPAAQQAAAPAAPATAPQLRVGPGDRIQITVFGVPELSGEFTVADTGAVSLPLAGQFQVAGLTTQQIETNLVQRLAGGGLVQNPQVSANVARYRQVFVVGEVTRAGGFDYFSGMTVINAVALAGGYTVRAARTRVTIVRAGDPQRRQQPADDNTYVLPGDVIQVPERWF